MKNKHNNPNKSKVKGAAAGFIAGALATGATLAGVSRLTESDESAPKTKPVAEVIIDPNVPPAGTPDNPTRGTIDPNRVVVRQAQNSRVTVPVSVFGTKQKVPVTLLPESVGTSSTLKSDNNSEVPVQPLGQEKVPVEPLGATSDAHDSHGVNG